VRHKTSTRRGGAISVSLALALCLAWAAFPWSAAQGAPAATFTVNSTNDVDDGACNAAHCSLREAINAANAAAGSDIIAFNIAGAGVKTISPTSALPPLTGPTIMDGLTQPGATCAAWPPTLLVVLSGAMAGPSTPGLQVMTSASTVRGLVVNGWDDYGIGISGAGNRVECSFVGTNAAGTAAAPNAVGIGIVGGGSNNIGGNVAGTRNLISGNAGDGVFLTNGVSNNAVYGNYIGVDVSGALDLGNGNSGVAFSNASNNTVGLPNPASRNVIAGNNNTGIVFNNGSNNNSVVANYIGLNAAGTAAVPNSVAGVFINNGAGNIIGDSSAPARNIISGNASQGVLIFGPSSGNFVRGNTIGLDPAGAVAIPNQGPGVRLASGATLNVIGGSVDAARNVISGNEIEGVLIHEAGTDNNTVERNTIGVAADGVTARPNGTLGVALAAAAGNQVLDNVISGNLSGGVAISSAGADNNVLQGNKIGVGADGVTPVGNGVTPVEGGGGPGVSIYQGDGNQVGGLAAGDGNIVAYNGGNGLQVQEGVGNRLRGNSIYSNGALGIDLDADGVTPNDPLDPDTGGNLLQNYPTLTSASVGGGVSVAGAINTTPSTAIKIDVYGNATCDSSGNGEGATHLGEIAITTNGSGDGPFAATFPVSPGGFWLTATATDPAGNTSEFGPCRALGCYLDFNSNGRVDVQDIMQVAARWNNPGAYNATYDVAPPFGSPLDIFDLTAVAEQWNTPCPVLER
jgi:CSLREA domain-containing protein